MCRCTVIKATICLDLPIFSYKITYGTPIFSYNFGLKTPIFLFYFWCKTAGHPANYIIMYKENYNI